MGNGCIFAGKEIIEKAETLNETPDYYFIFSHIYLEISTFVYLCE